MNLKKCAACYFQVKGGGDVDTQTKQRIIQLSSTIHARVGDAFCAEGLGNMKPSGILILSKFGANVGFAISKLESSFFYMAASLVDSEDQIHFAYKNFDSGRPKELPTHFSNLVCVDMAANNKQQMEALIGYVRACSIDTVFGLDLPVNHYIYRALRRAGVKNIISYWGAPMSSVNRGWKLFTKRIEVRLRRNGPDHYIFESRSMQNMAVNGRGIPISKTSVVNTGVDTKKYFPSPHSEYAQREFAIPSDRIIVLYTGHMQGRKGVDIIIKAAVELVVNRGQKHAHFLFLGNKPGEESVFDLLYKGTAAEDFITFGGYRSDVARIIPSCSIGVIASTGWDSFPMSALEMAASGLPVIVSNLQGLPETIEVNKTGLVFPSGDHCELANKIEFFLSNRENIVGYGRNARERAERCFSLDNHRKNLAQVLEQVLGSGG